MSLGSDSPSFGILFLEAFLDAFVLVNPVIELLDPGGESLKLIRANLEEAGYEALDTGDG